MGSPGLASVLCLAPPGAAVAAAGLVIAGVALLLPNVGGELDLAGASARVLARLTLGDSGDEFVLSVCQRPNTVLSTVVGELERPALVMTCTNSPNADPATTLTCPTSSAAMQKVIRPPVVRSCSETVTGYPGGPHHRSN